MANSRMLLFLQFAQFIKLCGWSGSDSLLHVLPAMPAMCGGGVHLINTACIAGPQFCEKSVGLHLNLVSNYQSSLVERFSLFQWSQFTKGLVRETII